jgi:hypothetical protein
MYYEQMKQRCGKKEKKEGFDGFLWLNIFVVSL